jgi:RHS repeat-associated protein
MSVELPDWFDYDWLSRRVATVTRSKGQGATAWTTVETRHFWYDGWNLMAETVASPPGSGATGAVAVTHRYAWGVDLGGTWEAGMGNHGPGRSQTAAGGVGALLGLAASNGNTYSATHDANGNVMGFIDLETGTLAARFDYDAFGNLITDWSAPDHHAWEISRIRFSGKYQDPHTGWLYYGYRYLDTMNGRWVSRDPIGEEGGLNLYGMGGNDGVNRVDRLGMIAFPGIISDKLPASIPIALEQLAGGALTLEEVALFLQSAAMHTIIAAGVLDIAQDMDYFWEQLTEGQKKEGANLRQVVTDLNIELEKCNCMPVWPVLEAFHPEIYKNTKNYLGKEKGKLLHYDGLNSRDPMRIDKRRQAQRPMLLKIAELAKISARQAESFYNGNFQQIDEFPYASTHEGGKGAAVAVVPKWENVTQGVALGVFYKLPLWNREPAKANSEFFAFPVSNKIGRVVMDIYKEGARPKSAN